MVAVRNLIASETNCKNADPVSNSRCSSAICADLLEAWRTVAHDPEDQVHSWLTSGAPAGVRKHPVHRNIFPEVDSFEEWGDGELLDTPDSDFVNYAGIDEDDDVWIEMAKHADKNFVTIFSTLARNQGFLRR